VKRIVVSVQVPSPDLTVPSVSFSPSVVVAGSGSVTVSWVEKNQGSGNAGAYRVGVYLGVSEYGRDYLLGSIYREGLAAGASASYTQAFPIPSIVPPGNYYVTVFIDYTGIVSESNENNNIGSSTPNRITVQATPTTGNLQVKVYNIEGRPLTWSGTVEVVLYDSNYVRVTSKSASFSPDVNYVPVVFTGLQAGTYIIEVYQTPNSGLRLREFWGANTGVEVRPGETRTFEFYRHTQVLWGVRFEGLDVQEQLPLGRSTTPKVTVKNYETFGIETKVRLIIDRDGSPPFDYDRTVATPILIPGNGATAEFTLPSFTPTEPGIYNYYAIALGKYGPAGGNFITTDQYFWSRAFVVPSADTVPPTVRVITPNGGERLTVGSVFRIRWEASDNVGVEKVHIWLFQGDTQVMVIASNLPNTGYYDWTVPNRPGGNYRIRIAAVDAAGNAAHDDSDGAFSIDAVVIVTAQIVSLTTDKSQYSVGETVRVLYTIRNTGEVRLDLRMVVEIVDPSGQTVYDSHRTNEDKKHTLDPGQSASGEFTWRIPADAAPGTYEVRASLREWNIWDKIFDYRWGDRPGPRFTVVQIEVHGTLLHFDLDYRGTPLTLRKMIKQL